MRRQQWQPSPRREDEKKAVHDGFDHRGAVLPHANHIPVQQHPARAALDQGIRPRAAPRGRLGPARLRPVDGRQLHEHVHQLHRRAGGCRLLPLLWAHQGGLRDVPRVPASSGPGQGLPRPERRMAPVGSVLYHFQDVVVPSQECLFAFHAHARFIKVRF